MGVQDITAVPQTPAHVKGVINLRGKVIPVVDPRLKFALPNIEYTPRTCIIVVQIQATGGGTSLTGLVVDGVTGAVNIAATEIEGTPDFGDGVAIPVYSRHGKEQGPSKDPLGYRSSAVQPGSGWPQSLNAISTVEKLPSRDWG